MGRHTVGTSSRRRAHSKHVRSSSHEITRLELRVLLSTTCAPLPPSPASLFRFVASSRVASRHVVAVADVRYFLIDQRWRRRRSVRYAAAVIASQRALGGHPAHLKTQKLGGLDQRARLGRGEHVIEREREFVMLNAREFDAARWREAGGGRRSEQVQARGAQGAGDAVSRGCALGIGASTEENSRGGDCWSATIVTIVPKSTGVGKLRGTSQLISSHSSTAVSRCPSVTYNDQSDECA